MRYDIDLVGGFIFKFRSPQVHNEQIQSAALFLCLATRRLTYAAHVGTHNYIEAKSLHQE